MLAAAEPHFDENRARLFHLDIRDSRVQFDVVPWAAQGDALNWLVSVVVAIGETFQGGFGAMCFLDGDQGDENHAQRRRQRAQTEDQHRRKREPLEGRSFSPV